MPEYGTDPATGLPDTGLPERTPGDELARLATALEADLPRLIHILDRFARDTANLTRELARWESVPPPLWDRMVEQIKAEVAARREGPE